jgi:predicted CopG family antitoxin
MANINVSDANKEALDNLKVHPKESYDEVVGRLIKAVKEKKP